MSSVSGFERRAIALLRARRNLVVVTVAASLVTAAVFALALATEDRVAAISQVLLFAAVLLPLIVGHGMISGDLRTGVAMLWLQKPLHPVAYFASRAIEVTALSTLLILALWGVGSAITAWGSGLAEARDFLAFAPSVVLIGICASILLFGFSAWGIQVDSMLAVACFFGSLFTVMQGGLLAKSLAWIVLPVEALGVVTQFLSGEVPRGDLGQSLLILGRFLLIWILIGTAGLFVSTRSPLPKEVSR